MREVRSVKLGVKTLQNCINIATAKMKNNQRALFKAWHHAVFQKAAMSSVTQRALSLD